MAGAEQKLHGVEQQKKVVSCFEKHGGNISAVANELNLQRSTIRHHLRNAGAGKKPLAGGKISGTKENRLSLPRGENIKRYILTAAQNNTLVHEDFWENVLALAEFYDARIMVGTFSYNQNHYGKLAVKRGKAKSAENSLWFDERLKPYFSDERVELAPGLTWCGEMNIQPTEQSPLSGLETYVGPSSVIFPHTKVEMRSVATTAATPVKLLYTTGCVTLMNYVQKKAGLKAEHHHRYACIVAEVDSKGNWWVRQVAARKNGHSIQDLNVLVENGKVISMGCYVEAITWGDLHATKIDPVCTASSLDMLDTLHPKFQFLHDAMEGASINPHTRKHKDNHEQFETWLNGLQKVTEEVKRTKVVLESYLREWCQTILPDANHDRRWFRQWLQDFDYRKDPGNAEFFLRLQAFMYAEMRSGKLPKNVNLMQHIFEVDGGMKPGAAKFLLPDEPFTVCGVECGMHGNLGPNGVYGAPGNLSKIGTKATTGHTHVAGIYHGLYVAGTSTKLTADWGYTVGPSAWTHSHVVLYPNGQRTVVTLCGGKWHAGAAAVTV
jgi:hypothetical protein